jgi:hypothetical protein
MCVYFMQDNATVHTTNLSVSSEWLFVKLHTAFCLIFRHDSVLLLFLGDTKRQNCE